MNGRALLVLLAFAGTAVSAAETDTHKYLPEIHGMLTSGKQPVASNVCLRESDSEIRTCGYADASGHFFIPASGPLHPARSKSDDRHPGDDHHAGAALRTYWLETGNVLAAQKLWLIDPVTDQFSAIELDCDMARAARADPAFRSCEVKTARQLVDHVPLDDTRYRMARPAKSPE